MAAEAKEIGFVRLTVRFGDLPKFTVDMNEAARVNPGKAKYHNKGGPFDVNKKVFDEILMKLKKAYQDPASDSMESISMCIDTDKRNREVRPKSDCS